MLPNVEEAFEVLPRGEAVDLLRWGFFEVPKKDFVAVSVKAEGKFAATLRLDVEAILLSLLPTKFRALGRSLRFDDG